MFPCTLFHHHEGAKENTIGVTRKINAKLPYCKGHGLTYPMKNEISFGHNVIE
jgi:hypothetical protein